MPQKTFTTHDIARFCDVYPSSVTHWINGGKLRAHQTAGGHHRVTREDLVDFLVRLNMRLPAELVTRQRVLVVDDEKETADLIARALSRNPDLEVETCGDGINALIRIGSRPPDLVILDIVIPKMDGIQVCRVLKEKAETRGIRIIAISGQKLPFSEKKLADLKIDGFFRKPLDLTELTERASELLRSTSSPPRSARAER